MKAYNEVLLKNKWVQDLASEWARKSILPKDTQEAIQKEYAEVPYKPHWFVWIGLFVFTLICISSGSILFLPLVNIEGSENFLPPIYGIAQFFFLNYLIKNRKLYFSGIDNAFLYCILFSLLTPFAILLSNTDAPPWVYGLSSIPVFAFLTYRYGEPLVALAFYLNILFIIASLAMYSPVGKLLLPFLTMIYAGISGIVTYRFLKKESSFYWKVSLLWILIASLVLFYLGGNYAIVREGNAALNSLVGESPEIAFALVFWFLTFLIPLGYIFLAFREKNLTFLVIGSAALITSLVTVQYYTAFMPAEWAITLLGLVGIGSALLLIRYFSVERAGFIYARDENAGVGLLAGNIIAMEVAGNLPDQPQGTAFGGGEFGGGGSGETY